MQATTLLRNDHRTVEGLFKKFEKSGPRAHKSRRSVVDRIIEELSVHAAIEEQLFYPAARAKAPDSESQVLEDLEEHNIVKWTLAALEDLEPTDERFVPRVTVLIENVRHHVEEEEDELFPKVQEAFTRKELDELGAQLEKAKAAAPKRPHPRSPDEPPFNLITGPAAALVDKARETVGRALGGD